MTVKTSVPLIANQLAMRRALTCLCYSTTVFVFQSPMWWWVTQVILPDERAPNIIGCLPPHLSSCNSVALFRFPKRSNMSLWDFWLSTKINFLHIVKPIAFMNLCCAAVVLAKHWTKVQPVIKQPLNLVILNLNGKDFAEAEKANFNNLQGLFQDGY